MTAAQCLAHARWLRAFSDRCKQFGMFTSDRGKLAEIAEQLETDGLERAVEEARAGAETTDLIG